MPDWQQLLLQIILTLFLLIGTLSHVGTAYQLYAHGQEVDARIIAYDPAGSITSKGSALHPRHTHIIEVAGSTHRINLPREYMAGAVRLLWLPHNPSRVVILERDGSYVWTDLFRGKMGVFGAILGVVTLSVFGLWWLKKLKQKLKFMSNRISK